ncbi:hypothetical protein Asp14428_76550 [Actinoplanes sp. NBRC 14428]|uniref:EAL domain-containing protein (Putative c-di-GMP-specific phosphodiesterase class I) n=1 Tax=Pseudosporangium ferrugineum TaxID=439699 RepID=A0A2T0RX89_9ACTN|nr:EAL domain-containing protein [Pseudosporangium ferrugineum]PRY25770.1 EAL domain-containing protein (putative c-di-GMP-specific phosphodiesterase class I) [Pseudosporangium ferrugineum]BCJ56180.1 hypothetical protein Asp14428_76550 [Actinoplanes sp. NBRC 14428]
MNTAELPVVERLLTLVRLHLGTEVAWASVLAEGRQVIVAAAGETAAMNIVVGDGTDADGSYCVRVLAGRLPAAVGEARRHPVTRDLAVTRDLRIGSYVGVPWRTPDGAVGGMLCCVSRHPDPGLEERSLAYLETVAAMLGDLIGGRELQEHHAAARVERAVRSLFDADGLRMVFQPAVRLSDGVPTAVEALARFDHELFPTPDRAFAAASRFRLGVDLELLAVRRAFAFLPAVPADMMMCVNLSAEALLDDRVQRALLAHADRRIGLEVTEHTQVSDYLALISVTERMRAAGIRIVVDDAGAGYASLKHILQLRPNVIKLDLTLVRDVDTDASRQALARSLVSFARDIGAILVAEGIETPAELEMLRRLGVDYGQGYLLARPASLGRILADHAVLGRRGSSRLDASGPVG